MVCIVPEMCGMSVDAALERELITLKEGVGRYLKRLEQWKICISENEVESRLAFIKKYLRPISIFNTYRTVLEECKYLDDEFKLKDVKDNNAKEDLLTLFKNVMLQFIHLRENEQMLDRSMELFLRNQAKEYKEELDALIVNCTSLPVQTLSQIIAYNIHSINLEIIRMVEKERLLKDFYQARVVDGLLISDFFCR